MAFDPNAIPKDLRPINIARTLAEDPRIPPISSPASIPVYYPSPIVDTGFTGLGGYNTNNNIIKNNNIPNGTPSIGIRNNPNSGVRKGGSASSQASDEGGDDSISGKKVKFLCSFGGKIMPRPSDGMLRYVGGQTKIITVRRDVSFVELVQKIINTCGQNLIIKYQLPDEDLDALVSVSCPEDLENMMDEYEKLVERSADGSPKLRVFLFSSSETDSSGMGNFVLQDNSRQYVEMVNSVADLVTPGSGIKRRESNASLTSTQNSDLSATEGIDSSTVAQGDLNLNKEKIAPIQDPSPRLKPLSPRIIVETETPSAQLNIPIIQPEHEWERPMPVNIHNTHNIHNIHPPAPYYQTFVDPQMGFPSQVMRNVSPIYTNNNVSNIVPPQQQYIAPMNMTMAPPPPSHVSMRENIMMPVMQPPQNNFAPRIIQLPNGQSYHAYPAQIGPSMVRGPYGWVPNQQIIGTFPEEIQKFKDCDLCKKSLPHAHSDTVVQGQRASIANPPIDTASVYHSLRVDDKKALPVRNFIEPQGNILSHIDNESGKTQVESASAAKIELYYDNNFDNSKAALPSYDVAMGIRPQQFQENAPLIQPMPAQYQYKQNITMNPLVNNDIHLVNESPKEYMNNILASAAKEVIVDSYDHVREIERPTENLHISPPETKPIVENVPIKPIMDFDLNYLHTNEMSPPLGEVSYIHTTRPIEFSEISKPPLLGNDTQYENRPDESSYKNFPFSEKVQPVDWSLDSSKLQPNLVPTDATVASSIPIKKVADLPQDSSNSLFSNQDPWDLQHDTHFPPPLPNKIAIRKDGLGTRAPFDENQFCDFGELTKGNVVERGTEVRLDEVDFASRTAQGSAEEQIKRDLQGVAEGVAASVLKSSMPSDPDLTKLERSEKVSEAIRNKNVRNDIEMHKTRNEETKSKLPEKANLGFPASDGIGSLQIIKNSDLEELRELGSGTFGTVYHGKWRGSDVAIKRINDRCFAGKPSEIERMRDDFWNEAIKLADLHHPNVVAFYGVVLDGPGGSVATVTEYMVNGSLRTALQKNERNLDKRKRLLIAMDVAFGMEYLHGKNIVHFDLKSDNLLVNLRDPHRPICKVGDLGLSKVKCQTLISGGVRGTLPWMAPELLNGSSSLVSEKVDVFSYGIVMWELITGEEPYADLHYGAIIGGIVSNTLRPPVPESCDPEWRSLMERCWSAEPSERPNFTEIANELRAIAAKIQSKTQNQQPVPSTQPQTKT